MEEPVDLSWRRPIIDRLLAICAQIIEDMRLPEWERVMEDERHLALLEEMEECLRSLGDPSAVQLVGPFIYRK
jgi:hypothetical protein